MKDKHPNWCVCILFEKKSWQYENTRDLTGPELVKALERFGYSEVRQTGSHIRRETLENGKHHLTVPNHKPLRLGTFAGILADAAAHFGLSRDEFLLRLLE
jgi:predicted RNA binding protein YcfA (HicA-like mRNA interferase family)